MKKLCILSLIVFCISLISCNNKGNEYVTYNEEGVPVIEIEDITEKGELAFSDLMKDFEITKLETKEECLIDDVFRKFATREYIIISTVKNGILLFSRNDGAFIIKITEFGNGPGEVSRAHQLEYNEATQTLYVVSDYRSVGRIKTFKLPDAEFGTIKINTDATVNDIAVRDSILTLVPLSFEDNCRVISQTISGREIFRINHTNENNAYYANVYYIDDQLMFNYSHGGNKMYFINNGELVPHSYYSVKGKMYQGMIQQEIGDILLFLTPLNTNLIRGYFSRVSGHESFDNSDFKRATFSEMKTFIFNKKKGSAYLVDKIKDDYLGSDKTINAIQSNGIFSQYYDVQELFNLRDEINKDPEADGDIKLRLNTLCDQL
ncbi:MAG: 6-bladed beta-propeller, partial [Bacteroidales bacterium]|nr:6-bladed beta-propeller [Bacteroidales bacterium]